MESFPRVKKVVQNAGCGVLDCAVWGAYSSSVMQQAVDQQLAAGHKHPAKQF